MEIIFFVANQTSGTFTVGNVQLEKGSTATSFDYRPYGTELVLAQRYYAKLTGTSGNAYVSFGSCSGTGASTASAHVKYPITMRTAPSISQSTTAVQLGTGGIYAVNSLGSSYIGLDTAYITLNLASSTTVGNALTWIANNSATGYVDFSAEL
jgi:hypothetical protein